MNPPDLHLIVRNILMPRKWGGDFFMFPHEILLEKILVEIRRVGLETIPIM